jgi:hypothetical protein
MGELPYDPEEHLEKIGVRLEEYPLRTAAGLYIREEQLVLVRPRLKKIHRRCVLAHEAAHAEAQHQDSGLLVPKLERYADLTAARNLIDPDTFADVKRWTDDPAEACLALGVTPRLLNAYIHAS